MRLFFLTVSVLATLTVFSQKNRYPRNDGYDRIFEYRYMQQPPFYPMGVDSCRRYYFNHFQGMDSLLKKVTAYGDTMKYLRLYFSFVIDKYGLITDPHFIRVASTRYSKSLNAKTVLYFQEDSIYYEKAVKQMLRKMGSWKPAMQDGVPVSCRMEDYFQFWMGITQPF